MEIVIKNNTPEELIATAAIFFSEKKRVENELAKLNRLGDFYEKELREIKNQYHTTKDGKVLHLSQMEDSHLLNTAILLEQNNRYGKRGVAGKYTNEIKKRGLAKEYFALLDAKNIVSTDEPEDDDEDEWAF